MNTQNLKIKTDRINLNYFVIENENGEFLKNETGKVHYFSTYNSADDVRLVLTGKRIVGEKVIKSIFKF